jgi:hypothetical protein
MEAKAHRRSSEMGTPMPGKSDAGWGCWLKISASSALNKADRQGDEGIFCLLTQQNGVTWRQHLGRWMTWTGRVEMDRQKRVGEVTLRCDKTQPARESSTQIGRIMLLHGRESGLRQFSNTNWLVYEREMEVAVTVKRGVTVKK